jgi:serine phosphatase RsbU (regulator of sigma subunit)
MVEARLEVIDAVGRRVVGIAKAPFTIGRRSENDLQLPGSDVSREHAEIIQHEGQFILRDLNSRYGTYVNGESIKERPLTHGDRIQLGRAGGIDVIFLTDGDGPSPERTATAAVDELRQIAALLEGLRALGSGRVLDDVLALVLDSAIEATGAERGFIMLSGANGALEMKLARARGRVTLSGDRFETSRKIPEEVFATDEVRVVTDLLDGDLANLHMGTVRLGIRHVLCAPLRLVRYVDRSDEPAEQKRIGVLYLDSREKGGLVSSAVRAALDTLAREAAVAIENARLYREALEKARLEQDLEIAGQIQRALLPKQGVRGAFYDVAGASLPCRAIGGDLFDYSELPSGALGVALGDVAGKGPPAALLMAVMQGLLSANTLTDAMPAVVVQHINKSLVRRAVESRFVTMFYAVLTPDGSLTYCNAGQNPPFLITRSAVHRLHTGGMILGLFDQATFQDDSIQLEPGDLLVAFSDGVSEALSADGEEFGDDRLLNVIESNRSRSPQEALDSVFRAVREFSEGAPQSDDSTAVVLRYLGSNA